MTFQEVATLLARMQLIDNRRVDVEVIREWHLYVSGLAFAVADEALTLLRSETSKWITPADIVAASQRILRAEAEPRDEYGNVLASDRPALAARSRLVRQGALAVGAGS